MIVRGSNGALPGVAAETTGRCLALVPLFGPSWLVECDGANSENNPLPYGQHRCAMRRPVDDHPTSPVGRTNRRRSAIPHTGGRLAEGGRVRCRATVDYLVRSLRTSRSSL